MPSASRPAAAYMPSGLSWSWKMSGRVRVRTFRPRSSAPLLGQRLQHEGAEAAHRALLDGDQRLVLAGQAQDQVDSSGLAKRASATVVERPRAASVSAAFEASARRVPNDRMATAVAFAHDAAPADLQRLGQARGWSTPTPSPRG